MKTLELPTVRCDIVEHVATVTLNRPAARNALNVQMCTDLVCVMETLAAADDVRAVLLTAAGSVYCAGADLKERQGMSAELATARRVSGYSAYAAIERLPQPIIAVVQGAAVGSGCEIAACCDFILASTDATFRYPEVAWGTVGATQRLPRIVGLRMAKEILLTGRAVTAAEAKALGLVNALFPLTALPAAALERARAIAAAPPLAVRLAKSCMDRGVAATREGAMALELLAVEQNLRHSDWKGAIAGFRSAAPRSAADDEPSS